VNEVPERRGDKGIISVAAATERVAEYFRDRLVH
jgi:hypothetical protein